MQEIVFVSLAMAMAGFVHTATGFGSALVGMPLLSFAVGMPVAAPLMAVMGQGVTAAVLWQNWHALHWRESLRLNLASLLGIPIGLWLLRFGNQVLITAALGVLLLAYALYGLLIEPRLDRQPPATEPDKDSWLVRCASIATGFTAGVLGGAYNANGPPLIVYGAVRRWPKAQFKSTLQSFFIVNGALILGGHAIGGLITREVLWYCACTLAPMLVGMALGWLADRYLHGERFRRAVLALVLILGAALLLHP